MDSQRLSSQFTHGYGDFALESCDGVINLFSESILAHMSPVFKDMFALGKENTKSLKLSEPQKTLELFLMHLDQKINKPSIDKDTIRDLLGMAHKYQVDAIIQWFDLEATTQRTHRVTGEMVREDEFALSHPGLALSLAIRYGLAEIGRLALRELCDFQQQKLLEEAPSLGFSVYLELCQLRDVRIKRYLGWINVLTKQYQSSQSKYGVSGVSYLPCPTCLTIRMQWLVHLTRAVHLEPSWKGFSTNYEAESRHCFPWSDLFRDLLPAWKEEALREESKLPEWKIEGI